MKSMIISVKLLKYIYELKIFLFVILFDFENTKHFNVDYMYFRK